MAGIDWLTARPIAHRALHGGALVENTLGAAAAAVAGNYGVEVDLQLTADGEAVVFHDATLDRLTEATGQLAERALAELKRVAFKDCKERIPTLSELLEIVGGRTPLLLELKSGPSAEDRLVPRVAKLLTTYAGPVAAMSFDPRLLVALRTHAPGLPRGIVAERRYHSPHGPRINLWLRLYLANLLHLLRTKPHFVAYSMRDLPALAPLLTRHALGMPLLTWTVRSEAEAKRARFWADQMIFEGFRP